MQRIIYTYYLDVLELGGAAMKAKTIQGKLSGRPTRGKYDIALVTAMRIKSL